MRNGKKAENFTLARDEDWTISPAATEEYLQFGKQVRWLGMAFNAGQVVLFSVLHVWPLAASCLIGMFFQFWVMRQMLQSQQESKWLIVCLWLLILLQAFIAVWILGAAAGFQFYVLALLPFNFSNMRQLLPLKILQVLAIIVFFLACDTWLASWQPVYALSTPIIGFLRHLNTIGACVMMAGISYAHALSIKAAEKALHQLASTDTLTGLLNRRRLTEIAEREQVRSRRLQEPLSVLLCDIDHFKRINDNFGHAAGDHVLQVLANIFQSTVREYDCVSRWGGEEFMVLLPKANLQTATQIAERLRLAVAQTHFRFEEKIIPVSMTLGVAQITGTENWHTALALADEALYRGKTEGRNRVVLADRPSTST